MIHATLDKPREGKDEAEAVVIEIRDDAGVVKQTVRVAESSRDWSVSITVTP